MTTATEKKMLVRPFSIEVCHPKNCDVFVQTLGQKIRGRATHTNTIKRRDRDTGDVVDMPVPAKLIHGLPSEIPGMILTVNPAELAWKIVDPLKDDPDLCRKIERAMKESESSVYPNARIRGVPSKSGILSVHQMKTLCRELCSMLDAEQARIVKGIEPDREDVDAMPGKYLLNPFNPNTMNQPQFEEDLPGWRDKLNRLG